MRLSSLAAAVVLGSLEAISDEVTSGVAETLPTHEDEAHAGGGAGWLNWLRAGVLGASDGIVSVADMRQHPAVRNGIGRTGYLRVLSQPRDAGHLTSRRGPCGCRSGDGPGWQPSQLAPAAGSSSRRATVSWT